MRNLTVIFICFVLLGCASVHVTYEKNLSKVIHIGMTKEQIYNINSSPTTWSRQIINGHTYETWTYNSIENTFDFADNVLIGYSTGHSGRYCSQSGIEDVRGYPSNDSH